ncbi:hypothetical protein [Dyadobacter sp. 676]|uniref:Uncharacterized protein n=1 Tax=Dyadobacter sp. 676 TaxID=3088362 RepID=A0AAU8FJX0_9BACT
MKLLAAIFIIVILLDIQRRIKASYVTQKQFADYKAGQDAINKDVEKRLASLESSAFA